MDVRGYISICMNSSLIITNSLCLEFKVYFNNLHPLCCCGDFKQIYDKERLHAGTKAPSRANQQAVHLPFLNGGKRKEIGQRNLTVFCVGLKSGSVSCNSVTVTVTQLVPSSTCVLGIEHSPFATLPTSPE